MSSNRKRVFIIKEKLKKLEEMLQDVSTNSDHSDVNQGNMVEVDVHREAELSPIPSDKIDSINKILGTDPSMPKVMGKPVSDQVASRLNYYATNGMSSDEKEKIRLEWPTPENCSSFNSPTLNPEILALRSPTDQKKDSFMCHIPNDIAGSLSALPSVLSKLLDIAYLPNVVLTDSIEILIPDILKTSGARRIQPRLRLPFFRETPELCLSSTLIEYLSRSQNIRNNIRELFLTIKKPYHPAWTQTLSRWLKKILGLAGINTGTFSGYSTRHAAVSAAYRSGTNIETIRATVGWSERSNVFFKFYNRPLDSSFFINSVLAGTENKQLRSCRD
ncbi:unnamed protein product [Acanthoscelides obtectus]|uniref:Tyr recombinase domain-containing protein n=1 Tax=Acanthoscelides obtectus TaxID=200917 RepID=A0A9P0KNS5_ACAOB|nr:unnamed protein product [Acanthoscelides obtectus]CAK1623526.1 hypothetical protein AOBTE_LOCUS2054 [Acanthoscelides obtectus]